MPYLLHVKIKPVVVATPYTPSTTTTTS